MSRDATDMKQALAMVGDWVLGAAVLIVLGVFGGAWLDARQHSAPLWTISLSILGGGLGLARLVIKAMRLDHNGDKSYIPPLPSTDSDVAPYSDETSNAATTCAEPPGTKAKIKPKIEKPKSAFDFLNQEDGGTTD